MKLRNIALISMMCLGLGILAHSLGTQPPPKGDFDSDTRIWTLANGLIEAQYSLDHFNRFQTLTLRRTGGKDWIANAFPSSSPIYLNIDGQVLDNNTRWELVDTHTEEAVPDGIRHVIQLRSDDAKSEVTLRLEIYPGQPFVRTSYSYRNLDKTPHYVTEARFFNLGLNTAGSSMRAFYVNQVRTGTPMMFDTFDKDLALEPNRSVTIRAGAYADQCTWLALRDSGNEGLALGWEFDGRSAVNAHLNDSSASVDVVGAPLDMHVPVDPGKGVDVPAAFLGVYQGDWDEAGFRTQRFVESVIASNLPDKDFPYLMYDTWGYGQNIDETTLRNAAQIASNIGVELFILDLGWARQIGEWQEDSVKFPGGMKAFADYVHSLGMKFGLHFVPEQVDQQAPVLQANSDWATSVSEDYYGAGSICISNQAAQDWLRSTTMNLIQRYNVDWMTQDGENMVKTCTKSTHTHDRLNSNWANSKDGIDALVSYTRTQAPLTQWENNADGGTMSTFEAVKRYATFGSCDACDSNERRQAVYGMSYVFPPRFIDRYMGDMPTKYTTRSSMFGGPWILMNRLTELSPGDVQLLQQEGNIYKQLRGLIREGKVYHISDRPSEFGNDAIESFRSDADSGVIFVYRANSPVSSQRIYPRGLRPEGRYTVRLEESKQSFYLSGSSLMQNGIEVPLPQQSFAEILYIDGSPQNLCRQTPLFGNPSQCQGGLF